MICSDVQYEYYFPIEVAELIMTPKSYLMQGWGRADFY